MFTLTETVSFSMSCHFSVPVTVTTALNGASEKLIYTAHNNRIYIVLLLIIKVPLYYEMTKSLNEELNLYAKYLSDTVESYNSISF